MAQVFVSYARADRDLASALVSELQSNDVSVWWDIDGLDPGDDWHDVIAKQVDDAIAVIVIWTEASARSEYVVFEATLGLKKLIPAFKRGFDMIKVPAPLRRTNAVPLDNREKIFAKLEAMGIELTPDYNPRAPSPSDSDAYSSARLYEPAPFIPSRHSPPQQRQGTPNDGYPRPSRRYADAPFAATCDDDLFGEDPPGYANPYDPTPQDEYERNFAARLAAQAAELPATSRFYLPADPPPAKLRPPRRFEMDDYGSYPGDDERLDIRQNDARSYAPSVPPAPRTEPYASNEDYFSDDDDFDAKLETPKSRTERALAYATRIMRKEKRDISDYGVDLKTGRLVRKRKRIESP